MSVFIDTSAFIAVLNANDHFHPPAKDTWRDLLQQGAHLTCNNYILVETFALLGHRFGLEAVRLFQTEVLPIVEVSWVDEALHNRAISAMLAANRRHLSLVDCTSFETMRHLGIYRAFTFDRHFSELGFEVIPTLNVS